MDGWKLYSIEAFAKLSTAHLDSSDHLSSVDPVPTKFK